MLRQQLMATQSLVPDAVKPLIMAEVYSETEGRTDITMDSSILPGRHLLVPSMFKKQAYGELGHKVSTYAGYQGITANEIQILIDSDTPMCSQQVMYTALSRAVHAIHFVNTGLNNDAFWNKLAATPYLAAFLRLVREERVKEDKPERRVQVNLPHLQPTS